MAEPSVPVNVTGLTVGTRRTAEGVTTIMTGMNLPASPADETERRSLRGGVLLLRWRFEA